MRNKKMEKGKQIRNKGIVMILSIVVGISCGMVAGICMDTVTVDHPLAPLLLVCEVCLCLYAAFFLQIIIHEAGHLIFGLLSGYRFCSFRIGSLMWIKKEGKLQLKRYSIAGTAG